MTSLGAVLAIVGIGLILEYLRPNSARKGNVMFGTLLGRGHLFGTLDSNNFRYGLLALCQSCIAVTLYSGLCDEYRSNPVMQQWVRSAFPLAQFLLTWDGLLAFSCVLGLVTVQFLPSGLLAE